MEYIPSCKSDYLYTEVLQDCIVSPLIVWYSMATSSCMSMRVSAHTYSDMVTPLQSANKIPNGYECLIKYNAIMNPWSMVVVKAIV